MLRVGASLCLETELLVALRRSARGLCRAALSSAAPIAAPTQTVLSSSARLQPDNGPLPSPPPPPGGSAPPPPPPPGERAPPPRRAWTAAAALAITASLGGVYYFRKSLEETAGEVVTVSKTSEEEEEFEGSVSPAHGSQFPPHVEYLIAGGGTAGLAAVRTLRALQPGARVLLAAAEQAPPYMRPPLTKELWRSPDARGGPRAAPHDVTFTQWNGKRRSLVYEPLSFFTPVEKLPRSPTRERDPSAGGDDVGDSGAAPTVGGSGGGAGLARGWRVSRLEAAARRAELSAPGKEPVTITFDKLLIATGSEPVLSANLRSVRSARRGGPVHTARDAARLARSLDGGATRIAVLGAGPRSAELSAALADRLGGKGEVVAVYEGERVLQASLPGYLAVHADRLLRERGVTLRPNSEVLEGWPLERGARLRVRTADGQEDTIDVDYVVEMWGSKPATEVWEEAGLETDARGVLVSAELAARGAVYAAGDAACWQRPGEARGVAQSHDHAVSSGRRAAENMAAADTGELRLYAHRPMAWAELGPELGYEMVGEVDASLQTVGVFSADAVSPADQAEQTGQSEQTGENRENKASVVVASEHKAGISIEAGALPAVLAAAGAAARAARAGAGTDEAGELRYARGVVLYVRGRRVAGVLLWNLFNRAAVARQVIEQGEFEDLFEVAKLFAPHEE